MKKIIQQLSSKAKALLDSEQATKDRPLHFRIVIVIILLSTVLFISYYLFQAIAKA